MTEKEQLQQRLEGAMSDLLGRVARIQSLIEAHDFDLASTEAYYLETRCASTNVLSNKLADID